MLDASGCYGCGAWSGTEWWQFKWPTGGIQRDIVFKELFAVVLAAETECSQPMQQPGCHCRLEITDEQRPLHKALAALPIFH